MYIILVYNTCIHTGYNLDINEVETIYSMLIY